MEITISIIARELSALFPIETSGAIFADAPLAAIMFLGDSVPQPQYLYLVTGPELDNKKMNLKGSTFLCLGLPEKKPEGCDCLYVLADCDIKEVYNDVQQVMEKFYAWRKQIRDMNCNVNNLQRLLSESRSYLKLGMFLIDKDFNYVAHTDDYMKKHGPVLGEKKLRMNTLNDLLTNPVYLAAKANDETFLYPSRGKEHVLCYNIKVEKKYVGRLLTDSENGTYCQGDRKLVEYLGLFITDIFKKDYEKHIKKQEQDIFRKIIGNILEGKSQENKKISPILLEQGWTIQCQYQVFVFSLIDINRNEFSKEYYCKYLEDLFYGSCALRNFEQITLVVNISLLNKDEKAFTGELSQFLEKTNCKTGKSLLFSDISLLTYHKKQAEMALIAGSEKKSKKRIYDYSTLRLDCIFTVCTADLLPEHLCNPILLRLKAYDKIEGTELYATLKVYLEEQFNVSHAAKRLFVHRTTLLYRLERIKEISQVESLTSWNLILDLMMSYTLMDEHISKQETKPPVDDGEKLIQFDGHHLK